MMGNDEPEAAVEAPAGTKATQGQGAHKPINTGAVPAAAVPVPAADPLAGMTVEQRYVAADSASVASGSGGSAGAVMAVSGGGTIVRVGERPMGTFPESKPYPPSF